MTIEYGIFSDEGLLERDSSSAEEAERTRTKRYAEDDATVHPVCHDHPEHPAHACEKCDAEDSEADAEDEEMCGRPRAEVFTMADQQNAAERMRAVILARINAIGQAEAARRVAPLWGWTPRNAETRLSRWRNGTKSMSSDALLALLVALDLTIPEETT